MFARVLHTYKGDEMKKVFTGLILLILSNSIFAQVDKKGVQNSINKRAKEYEKIVKSIWDWAEMGYQEEKSSALLQKTLSNAEVIRTQGC